MSDLSDKIAENAQGPSEVSIDDQTVRQHGLRDQIEADRYAKANAATKKAFPLRRARSVPPGAS